MQIRKLSAGLKVIFFYGAETLTQIVNVLHDLESLLVRLLIEVYLCKTNNSACITRCTASNANSRPLTFTALRSQKRSTRRPENAQRNHHTITRRAHECVPCFQKAGQDGRTFSHVSRLKRFLS